MFGQNGKQEFREFLMNIGLPFDSDDYFWSRHPKRASEELVKMGNSTNASLRLEGSKLILEEEIVNNLNHLFTISIEVDNSFPYSMPKISVIDPPITYEDLKGKHIYKDNHICLIEPNKHSSGMSILDFRNLACEWCFAVDVYLHTGEWPTAQAD